jgi:hypothetical protein
MSDFFGDLYGSGGIRNPEVVMNDGPLPPMSGLGGAAYPTGFNGIPDGRIDYASTLLGNVNPYSYGEADRLSTQTAYLNIPHRVQRIVPTLSLPEAQMWESGGSFFRLSHQVDDGDIAFVIRAMFSPYELVEEKKKYNRQGILYAVDPVVNLATVNYILHGLQRFGHDKKKHVGWNTLWQALGIDHHFAQRYGGNLSTILCDFEKQLEDVGQKDARKRLWIMCFIRRLRRELVDHIVKNVIRPFGVPTGSERQGGQHQGSNSAITWPVDFVTTLTIDGLVINMVNFWRHEDVNSGDDLMLYVEERNYTEYVLSHHPKNVRKQVFPQLRNWDTLRALDTLRNGNEDAGKKKRQREVNWSGNAAAMMLDRMWDLSLNVMGPMGDATKGISKNVEFEEEEVHSSSYAHKTSTVHKFVDGDTMFERMKNVINDLKGYHFMQGALRDLFESESDIDKFNITIDSAKEPLFQLVPGISGSASCGVRNAVWRHGYWHIARSQTMHFKYDQHLDIPNGYHAAVRGKVLQVTFAPVWMEPLEDAGMFGGVGATNGSTFAVDYQDRHGTGKKAKQPRLPGIIDVGGGAERSGLPSIMEIERAPSSGKMSSPVIFKTDTMLKFDKVFDIEEFKKLEYVDEITKKAVVTWMNAIISEKIVMDGREASIEEIVTRLLDVDITEDTTRKTDYRKLILPAAVAIMFRGIDDFKKDFGIGRPLKVISNYTLASVMARTLSGLDTVGLNEFKSKFLIASKKGPERKTIARSYYLPSMVATAVRLVEGSESSVPILPADIMGMYGEEMVNDETPKLKTLTLSACAMSMEAATGRTDELKNFVANKSLSSDSSVEFKTLKFMTQNEIWKLVKVDDVAACMVGAYIGACIGLGCMKGLDHEECFKPIADFDSKKKEHVEKLRKRLIAIASSFAVEAGIRVATSMWSDEEYGKHGRNVYTLAKSMVPVVWMCFCQIYFLASGSENVETLTSVKIDVQGVVKTIQTIPFFGTEKEDFEMRARLRSFKFESGLVEPLNAANDAREYLGNELKTHTTMHPYKLAQILCTKLVLLPEQEYVSFVKEMKKDELSDLSFSLKLDTHSTFADFDTVKLIGVQKKLKTLKSLRDFVFEKYKIELLEVMRNTIDSDNSLLKSFILNGALDKSCTESFMYGGFRGIHVEHYHKALSAFGEDAMKCITKGADFYCLEETKKIIDGESVDKNLKNLVVAPAMILSCCRMVCGEKASEKLTLAEEKYQLVDFISKYHGKSEISATSCIYIACAMACNITSVADKRSILQKVLEDGNVFSEKPMEGTAEFFEYHAWTSEIKPTFMNADVEIAENYLLIRMMNAYACAWCVWTMRMALKTSEVENKHVRYLLHDAAKIVYTLDLNGVITGVAEKFQSKDSVYSSFRRHIASLMLSVMKNNITDNPSVSAHIESTLTIVNTSKDLQGTLENFIRKFPSTTGDIRAELHESSELKLMEGIEETIPREKVAAAARPKLKKVQAKLLS